MNNLTNNKFYTLGNTNIVISAVGLGCWQFSNDKGVIGKYWKAIPQELANDIIKTSITHGVNWFDTAELYGNGESERTLAKALQQSLDSPFTPFIATKWNPLLRTYKSIINTIETRRECLAPYPIDLHQIHFPYGSLSTIEMQMDGMAKLVEQGCIKHIGVSNFKTKHLLCASKALSSHNLLLSSNQVKYSLIDRSIESNGALDLCKKLGITIIAYSPLAQGMLTGKFHSNPELLQDRSLLRKFLSTKTLMSYKKCTNLLKVIGGIANSYGVQCAQIALRWLTQFHGDTVVAIPGASNVKQATSNAQSMDFTLTQKELDDIDKASQIFM